MKLRFMQILSVIIQQREMIRVANKTEKHRT